jgi:hypothetical protein
VALRNDQEAARALDDVLADICDHVHSIIATHLPIQYKSIKAFVDVLPLNQSPTSYPFASTVINIQVATEGHADEGDDQICVVIPLGEWEKGSLVLHELGVVLELSEGDVVVFPSCKITHFNLDFEGVRCSIVLFSDKHGKDWVRFRNGWSGHIAEKKSNYDTESDEDVDMRIVN